MVDPVILHQANARDVIGNCWFAPWLENASDLSPEYRQRWMRLRPPIVIVTPGLEHWCIDKVQYRDGVPQPAGWTISGNPDGAYPCLSASPSILLPRYHGWLKDGFLSPDLEKRTYYEGPKR